VIAASDYVRAVPESIRAYVPARFVTLGTDGFGRSDTRASLRDFCEVDAKRITYTALAEVYAGKKTADEMREIAAKLELDVSVRNIMDPSLRWDPPSKTIVLK
jgi:pyruvate dehydrogenase E1 component